MAFLAQALGLKKESKEPYTFLDFLPDELKPKKSTAEQRYESGMRNKRKMAEIRQAREHRDDLKQRRDEKRRKRAEAAAAKADAAKTQT